MRLSAVQGRALRLCADGHGRDEMRVRGVAWWNAHQDLEVAGLVKRERGMPVRFSLTVAGLRALAEHEASQ